MDNRVTGARAGARYLLAAIRLVNGTLALGVPSALARRLEVDTANSPGILYFERMFGIRTVLIAVELVTGDAEQAERALRRGRIIHASDAFAAVLAGLLGNLKPRPALVTTAISLVNLLLASVATPPRRRARRLRRVKAFGG